MEEETSIQKKKKILEEQLKQIRREEELQLIKNEYPILKKKYEGKYFKYKNSYGSEKTWNMYTKVTNIPIKNISVRNGIVTAKLVGYTFQTDCYGKIDIEHTKNGYTGCLGTEISKKEFTAAWNKMINAINKLK